MTRHPVIETANLDYHSHDCVALVARFEIAGRLLDVYVTHLIAAKVEDSARQYQVTQLLEWIRSRDDADCSVVCGDFNAAPDQPSIRLMSTVFRPTQSQPTAFTPLQEPGGAPTHPEWQRFDRCIDYIWISQSIKLQATGLCFNQPDKDNPAAVAVRSYRSLGGFRDRLTDVADARLSKLSLAPAGVPDQSTALKLFRKF